MHPLVQDLFYPYSKSLNVLVDQNGAIVFNVGVCFMRRTDKSRGNSGMDSKNIYLARSKVQDLKLQQYSHHLKLTFSLSCW